MAVDKFIVGKWYILEGRPKNWGRNNPISPEDDPGSIAGYKEVLKPCVCMAIENGGRIARMETIYGRHWKYHKEWDTLVEYMESPKILAHRVASNPEAEWWDV